MLLMVQLTTLKFCYQFPFLFFDEGIQIHCTFFKLFRISMRLQCPIGLNVFKNTDCWMDIVDNDVIALQSCFRMY